MNYLALLLIGFLLGIFAAKISFFVFLTTKVLVGLALVVTILILTTVARIKFQK